MSTTETLTNGEAPKSQFIDHLISYPVVNDSVETYKQNQYGKRSIEVAQDTYNRFGKPVVPHLQGPYSFVKPYVVKADSLANNGLSYVDEKFPIVKEDSATLKQTAVDYVSWPFHLVFQGRDYLFNTYADEYKKTGKDGDESLIHTGKAVISTELRVVSETIQYVQSYLGPKRDEATEWASQKRQQIDSKINGVQSYLSEKAGHAQKEADNAAQKADEKING